MRLISCFLALALSTSATLADDLGKLSPGHPAGVKKADEIGTGTWLAIGLGAAAIAGIAIAVSGGDDNTQTPVPPVTTS